MRNIRGQTIPAKGCVRSREIVEQHLIDPFARPEVASMTFPADRIPRRR